MEKVNKSCLDSYKIEHLIRILNLTTSNYDGEALSAARRANEFLKSHEMRWADILFNNSLNSKEKNIEILISESKLLKE